MIATQDNLYHVKAVNPPSNWKTQALPKAVALEKAICFVRGWSNNGFPNAKAAIFYRDGSHVVTISANNLSSGQAGNGVPDMAADQKTSQL